MTSGTTLRRGWRLKELAVALLLLVIAVVAARAILGSQAAQAQSGGCPNGACVMLIEVTGLQPTELTREKTPVMWSLAHPQEGSDAFMPGRRHGFIWQAPRAEMTTSSAAATMSLLTGASPRDTGVPADYYLADNGSEVRLGGGRGRFGRDVSVPSTAVPALPRLVNDQLGGRERLGRYVGDPEIAAMLHGAGPNFHATRDFNPGSAGLTDPSLCAVPEEPQQSGSLTCPVRDAVTLEMAANGLLQGSNIAFSYIHLAELGKTKQRARALRAGDHHPVGAQDEDRSRLSTADDVNATLAEIDAALGSFLARLSAQDSARLSQTVIVLTGSHGYEPTRPDRRVPHPEAPDPSNPGSVDPGDLLPVDPEELDELQEELDELLEELPVPPEGGGAGTQQTSVQQQQVDAGPRSAPYPDLGDYVRELGAEHDVTARLIPQGTVATVYISGDDEAAKQAARDDIFRKIGTRDQDPSNQDLVNEHGLCTKHPGGVQLLNFTDPEGCIDEVLYMKPALKADGSPEHTVADEHPTWRLDPDHGDMLIVMTKGWAAGRALPSSTDPAGLDVDDLDPLTNPYPASSGGPRNRAIAALVNGPPNVVRQFEPFEPFVVAGEVPIPGHPQRVERMPVTHEPGASGDPRRDAEFSAHHANPVATATGGLAIERANENPGDDEDDRGHECQPRTVDFAPTAAALMGLQMTPRNTRACPADSRLLQEAFRRELRLTPAPAPPSGDGDNDKQEPTAEPDPRPSPPAEAAAPRPQGGPAMELMLAPTLISSVSSSRRFTVRWSPSATTAAAVRSYELQGRRVSTRTGRPASEWVTVLRTRQTGARLVGNFGETYQLRVRALDASDRPGEWRTSGRVIMPLNATTRFVRHTPGGWVRSRSRSAFAGSLVRARGRGASIALKMPARRMAIIAPTSPRGGAIRISVGRRSATIPLRSRRTSARRVVLVTPALRPGTTVRITALSRGTSIDGFAFAG